MSIGDYILSALSLAVLITAAWLLFKCAGPVDPTEPRSW